MSVPMSARAALEQDLAVARRVTVGFARLAPGAMIVAGLGVSGVVGVLVGEPVRHMTHLVDRDLGGASVSAT